MKKDIHPKYQFVVFQDTAANYSFLTRSTLTSGKTVKWEDGKEYPVISMEISSASHPFYTGRQKLMDTAGRVERFAKRFAKTGGQTVARKPAKTKAASAPSAAVGKKVLRNAPIAAPGKQKPAVKPKVAAKPEKAGKK